MAKKVVQAFQAEIKTDEGLEEFLNNTGLSVLDVYSEWCGPCIGMITTLKKIKTDPGGEFLFLAICSSDTIESLARFRNKSEPTWLFVYKYSLIHIEFGVDLPKLTKVLQFELARVISGKNIPEGIAINELLPVEKDKLAKIAAAAEKVRLAQEREAKKKRLDYLNFCTSEILTYLPVIGVILIAPHVSRDLMKIIQQTGESEGCKCNDKKIWTLHPDDIEVLHYACNNPINEDVLDQWYGKDLLVMFWKKDDTDTRPIEEIMNAIANKLTKPQNADGDDVPPILTSIDLKIKEEKKEPEMIEEEPVMDMMEFGEEEEVEEEGDEEEADVAVEPIENVNLLVQKSSSYLFMVTLPPVWTPGNKKTSGAAIYVFFRNQTTAFLPPDPVPSPPHLIVIFDAWKRKDVTDVMNKYSEEILTYGYFTADDPNEAQLIANSNNAYMKQKQNRLDKLVVKVAKRTSHTVLALAAHFPVYVSPNTDIGKIEADKFFPEGYDNEE